jgi:DNA repair exonuclease SbcCD ATPase subunit
MRFLDLELKNFGGHESLVCPDLNAAIIGISGTNGKGKTTAMRALRYILTGDLPEDNAQSYMRNGGAGGTTIARSRMLVRGETGVMTRKITKSGQSRELVWNSGAPVTKDSEVQIKLRGLLGADLTTIGNAVFVPQGKLDELLFSSEAIREQQFLRMIGCAHFENVSRTAAKEASQLLASAPDVEGTLAECRTQMRDYTSRWDELKAEAEARQDMTAPLLWLRRNIALLAEEATTKQQAEVASQALRAIATQPGGAASSAVAAILLQQTTEAFTAVQAELDHCAVVDEKLRTKLGDRRNYDIAKGQRDAAVANCWPFEGYTDTSAEIAAELGRIQAAGAEVRTRKDAATAALAAAKAAQASAEELRKTQVLQKASTQKVNDLVAQEPPTPTQDEVDDLSVLRSQLNLASTLAKHTYAEGSEVTCPLCASSLDISWVNPAHTQKLELRRQKLQREFDAKTAAHAQWRSDLAQAQRALATLDAKCDQGATPATYTQHGVDELAANEALLASELESMQRLYRDTQAKLSEEQPKAKAFNNAHACLAQAQSSLENIWGPRAVEMEAVMIDAVQTELTTNSRKLDNARARSVEARDKKEKLIGLVQALKNAEQNIEAAKQRYDSAVVERHAHKERSFPIFETTEYAALSNEAALVALEAEQDAHTKALGAADEMQNTINAMTARVVELQEQRDKSAKARYTAERLTLLSAAFQRDGISRHYTAAVYAKLLLLVSQHLENLDANFVIRRAEDVLTFEFMRTDEDGAVWLPQHKLSGGQRVRMAVAFLLAVQQLILPEVGLLVLDEPTDGLDPSGRADLRDTLERAAEILESNDAQMIICDHSGTLDPVYRATIKL